MNVLAWATLCVLAVMVVVVLHDGLCIAHKTDKQWLERVWWLAVVIVVALVVVAAALSVSVLMLQ